LTGRLGVATFGAARSPNRWTNDPTGFDTFNITRGSCCRRGAPPSTVAACEGNQSKIILDAGMEAKVRKRHRRKFPALPSPSKDGARAAGLVNQPVVRPPVSSRASVKEEYTGQWTLA